VTVPAEVILKIIELTSVEAVWLLHGEGPKFRHGRTDRREVATSPTTTIGALLRTALELLERDEPTSAKRGDDPSDETQTENTDDSNDPGASPRHAGTSVSGEDGRVAPADKTNSALGESRREWQTAQRDNRCIKVSGDAMAPVVADGASVAFARDEEDVKQLDGKMVVTWLENNHAVVRWFQHCGRFALLRAENPATVPQQLLVDLEDARQRPEFRRVLWINTPH
jgi:phage repressor protein C with HTH and peptisase S24 domain